VIALDVAVLHGFLDGAAQMILSERNNLSEPLGLGRTLKPLRRGPETG
jgi:hypothetical protein